MAVKQDAKGRGVMGETGENKSGSSFTVAGLGVPLQGANSFQSSLEEFQCVVGQILAPLLLGCDTMF